MMTECHLSVQLGGGGPLHFRAERSAAEHFAAAAGYLAIVSIDEYVHTGMAVMPYQELWQT